MKSNPACTLQDKMILGTRAISSNSLLPLRIKKCTLPFHLVFRNVHDCLIPLTYCWINDGLLLEEREGNKRPVEAFRMSHQSDASQGLHHAVSPGKTCRTFPVFHYQAFPATGVLLGTLHGSRHFIWDSRENFACLLRWPLACPC